MHPYIPECKEVPSIELCCKREIHCFVLEPHETVFLDWKAISVCLFWSYVLECLLVTLQLAESVGQTGLFPSVIHSTGVCSYLSCMAFVLLLQFDNFVFRTSQKYITCIWTLGKIGFTLLPEYQDVANKLQLLGCVFCAFLRCIVDIFRPFYSEGNKCRFFLILPFPVSKKITKVMT